MTDDNILLLPTPSPLDIAPPGPPPTIEELRELIYDMYGPTVAWAATHAQHNDLPDGTLHPEHQAVIDRARRVLSS